MYFSKGSNNLPLQLPMNVGNSYGMGVGVGQLKSEGHFFLAAEENKFYSPGTTQQFLPWSVKHSQKSVGVLAEKGAEFLVELGAPYNALACNVLQICSWAGEGMEWTSSFTYRSWTMRGGLYRLTVLHLVWTCIPTLLPQRYGHHIHWRALAGGRAEGWPIDSETIYHPCLPMEGHPDLRHSHGSSHTDPKEPEEQLCPQPACGGDGVQPMCCSWHRVGLRGAARTKFTFNIRQPLQRSQRRFGKEKDN